MELVNNDGESLDQQTSANVSFSVAGTLEPIDSFPYCSSFDVDLGDWTTEIVSGTSDWTSAASNTTTGSSSTIRGSVKNPSKISKMMCRLTCCSMN